MPIKAPVAEPLPVAAPRKPNLTIEEAGKRIGPKVLRVLEEKFNGSLVVVRAPDERDQLF